MICDDSLDFFCRIALVAFMDDRHKPQTRAREGRGRLNILSLKTILARQAVLHKTALM